MKKVTSPHTSRAINANCPGVANIGHLRSVEIAGKVSCFLTSREDIVSERSKHLLFGCISMMFFLYV